MQSTSSSLPVVNHDVEETCIWNDLASNVRPVPFASEPFVTAKRERPLAFGGNNDASQRQMLPKRRRTTEHPELPRQPLRSRYPMWAEHKTESIQNPADGQSGANLTCDASASQGARSPIAAVETPPKIPAVNPSLEYLNLSRTRQSLFPTYANHKDQGMTKLIYHPLPFDDSIRLLFIHPGDYQEPIRCSLIYTRLCLEERYEALSYAWGPACPIYDIFIDGIAIQVRQNLYNALLYLRSDRGATILWADAICLNQQDIPERNHQVKIMKRIYENASNTIIWLGRGSEGAIRALNLLQSCENAFHKEPWEELANRIADGLSSDGTPSLMSKSFRSLFATAWFGRMWVLQEFVVSRKSRFVCGEYSFAPETLRRACIAIRGSPPVELSLWDCLLTVEELLKVRSEKREGIMLPLSELLWRIMGKLKASDPRDHIFALLGLVDNHDGDQVSINYEIQVEVLYIRVMTQFLCQNKDLHTAFGLLSRTGDISKSKSRKSLPSWVPDFSATPPPGSLFEFMPFFSASRGSIPAISVSDSTLSLKGKIIDAIKLNLPFPFEKAISTSEPDFQTWIASCRGIASRDGAFYIEDGFEKTWWRLLVCDLAYSPNTFDERYKLASEGYGEYFLSPTLPEYLTEPQSFSNNLELNEAIKRYNQTCDITSNAMSFCSTEKGLLGWIPDSIQKGDKICIFAGAKSPFVLRERPDGSYELIGNAYIHGIMYGEAMDWEGIKWETILIR